MALSMSPGANTLASCRAARSSAVAARMASEVLAAAVVAPRSPRKTLVVIDARGSFALDGAHGCVPSQGAGCGGRVPARRGRWGHLHPGPLVACPRPGGGRRRLGAG